MHVRPRPFLHTGAVPAAIPCRRCPKPCPIQSEAPNVDDGNSVIVCHRCTFQSSKVRHTQTYTFDRISRKHAMHFLTAQTSHQASKMNLLQVALCCYGTVLLKWALTIVMQYQRKRVTKCITHAAEERLACVQIKAQNTLQITGGCSRSSSRPQDHLQIYSCT